MEQKTRLLIAVDNEFEKCLYADSFTRKNYLVQTAPLHCDEFCAEVEKFRPHVVMVPPMVGTTDCITLKRGMEMVYGMTAPKYVVVMNECSQTIADVLYSVGIDIVCTLPVDLDALAIRVASAAGHQFLHSVYQNQLSDDEALVCSALRQISLPAHLNGYAYLRDCSVLVLKHGELLHAVTKQLYPEVAKMNGTTASRLERAMRFAIRRAWDRADKSVLEQYFGSGVVYIQGCPTNGQVIAAVVERVKMIKSSNNSANA